MAHAPSTISIMHSIRQWPRPPARTANFARRFVMNWMKRGVFPAEKSPDLTGVFDLRAATSTTMRAAYSKKRKAHRTALFSIKSFTATTRPESRLAIPFSMRPENCWAARVPQSAARLPPQNRARKLGDDSAVFEEPDAKGSRLPLRAAESHRLLACHSWERALEKSV